jgi:hypothetical protein
MDLERARRLGQSLVSYDPDAQPGDIFVDLHCGWQGCNRVFPFGVFDLIKHAESVHLREVKETWCPFRRKLAQLERRVEGPVETGASAW